MWGNHKVIVSLKRWDHNKCGKCEHISFTIITFNVVICHIMDFLRQCDEQIAKDSKVNCWHTFIVSFGEDEQLLKSCGNGLTPQTCWQCFGSHHTKSTRDCYRINGKHTNYVNMHKWLNKKVFFYFVEGRKTLKLLDFYENHHEYTY